MNSAAVEQVIARLQSLPPAQRRMELERAVREDPTLERWRDRIVAAVHLDESQTGALPTPEYAANALEAALEVLEEEAAGTRIGPYKLLERLGEGGFGVVWMAEQQEPIRRRVALKIIKAGMDTREVIARFEAERQALALMDHPNIARVFDAGATESGRPFFVMELVRGIAITRYCDENRLTPDRRLQLVIAVGKAVQHAHQKGVIHRDLKPSNILVTLHDGVPVPKIIDFGIAKAAGAAPLTDKTLFTRFHTFLGSPTYTSPEQMELSGLDVDTRSDIYSLGVVLYELLTGQTPFTADDLARVGFEAMRRTIRDVDPPRPSHRLATMSLQERTTVAQRRGTDARTLTLRLRGDLDWIVMHCLEKDRTRRYETANGLVRDIERHLASEPVAARPPSTAYRMQKFVRRHRLAVIAAAGIAMTVLSALVVSSLLLVRERAARARAVTAERAEGALRAEAERARTMETKRASHTALRLANQLCDEGRTAEALAYFVHAARKDPTNVVIAPRLMSALASRNFLLPNSPPAACRSAIQALHFARGGRELWVGAADGTYYVFNTSTRTLLREARLGRPVRPGGWLFAERSEARFAVWFVDGTATVFDAATVAPLWNSIQIDPQVPRTGFGEADNLDGREGVDVGISPLQLSADGRWLAAHSSRRFWVWDAMNGELRLALDAPAPISNCDFSRDGTQLLLAAKSTLQLWQLPGFGLLREIALDLSWQPIPARSLFSPDGRQIATWNGRHPGSILVFDTQTGALIAQWSTEWTFLLQSSLQYLPDGRYFAVGMHASNLWDLSTGKTKPLPYPWRDTFRSNSLSSDHSLVLTTSSDGHSRLWSTATLQLAAEPTTHETAEFVAALSPAGTEVAIGRENGELQWLRVGRGAIRPRAFPQISVGQLDLFASDEFARSIAHFGDEASLTATMLDERTFPTPRNYGFVTEASPDALTCFLRADRKRAVLRHPDGRWEAWTIDKSGRRTKTPLPGEFDRVLYCVLFSPQGERVVRFDTEEVNIHELQDGRLTIPPWRPDTPLLPHSVNFSPDGSQLAAGAMDGSVRICDLERKTTRKITTNSDSPIVNVRYSGNGRLLVTANARQEACVWDANSGQAITGLLDVGNANDACLSPDGQRVITWGPRTARVWEVPSGTQVGQTIPMGAGRRRLRLSADGQRIVIGGYDDQARVWDARTGQAITEPMRSGSTLYRAIFSADDREVWMLDPKPTGVSLFAWPIPPPLPAGMPTPEWLLTLATVCAGKIINDHDQCVDAVGGHAQLAEVRRDLARLPADAPLADWGRWFLDESPNRSIAPGFTITPAEAETVAAGSDAALAER